MNIVYTARKTVLKDSFKEKTEKKLAKLDRFFDRDARVRVTVTSEKDRETVEITISAGNLLFRSEKTSADRGECLETVVDNLFTQIVRNKEKLVSRLKQGAFETVEPEIDEHELFSDYDLVRSKKIELRPMSVENAVFEMQLVGHTFYMFLNEKTDNINVVYLRDMGGYGLLEPR